MPAPRDEITRPQLVPLSAQTPEALRALALAYVEELRHDEGASLSDVVSLTTYHVNMGETVRPFMEVKDEVILEPYPTWTAIGVERLFGETALLEVAAVAVIPN